MLKLELKYWGISERLFQIQARDKFEILEELFNKDYIEIFEPKESSQEFFRHLENSKLKFADIYKSGGFKFKDDFRIKSIREIAQIEYGADFSQKTEIGRYWGMNYDE